MTIGDFEYIVWRSEQIAGRLHGEFNRLAADMDFFAGRRTDAVGFFVSYHCFLVVKILKLNQAAQTTAMI